MKARVYVIGCGLNNWCQASAICCETLLSGDSLVLQRLSGYSCYSLKALLWILLLKFCFGNYFSSWAQKHCRSHFRIKYLRYKTPFKWAWRLCLLVGLKTLHFYESHCLWISARFSQVGLEARKVCANTCMSDNSRSYSSATSFLSGSWQHSHTKSFKRNHQTPRLEFYCKSWSLDFRGNVMLFYMTHRRVIGSILYIEGL